MTGPALEQPALAVVVPVHNEAESIVPLVEEIRAALAPLAAATGGYEIVYVDDGSTDAGLDTLKTLSRRCPELRVIRHVTCAGQSTAVATGVRMARAPVIATLDGDGQNDPADIPKLLDAFKQAADPDRVLIAGLRAKRRDSRMKRLSSRLANRVRAALLNDDTQDTGCGLKVFSRAAFLDMPRFDHMHRFLPALMKRRGGTVVSVAVNHRPRERGQSKYGVMNRLWVGIVDLFGVMWLQRRARNPETVEVKSE
ncbi:MAG: glycosyltransferase [Rhodospirillales bacterium]